MPIWYVKTVSCWSLIFTDRIMSALGIHVKYRTICVLSSVNYLWISLFIELMIFLFVYLLAAVFLIKEIHFFCDAPYFWVYISCSHYYIKHINKTSFLMIESSELVNLLPYFFISMYDTPFSFFPNKVISSLLLGYNVD